MIYAVVKTAIAARPAFGARLLFFCILWQAAAVQAKDLLFQLRHAFGLDGRARTPCAPRRVPMYRDPPYLFPLGHLRIAIFRRFSLRQPRNCSNTPCMKCLSKQEARGFTRVELAVVIVVVALLCVLLAPSLRDARHKAWRIYCNNNMKELGTAYRLWAGDHNHLMPFQASMTNGGWRELLASSNAGQYCWTNYAILREELGESPKLVICPADERKPAANFIVKGATNDTGNAAFKDNTTVSYFVGVTANDTYPQSIQGGDRNLGPGVIPDPNYGYSPTNGNGNDVVIPINGVLSWSLKMHSLGNPAGAGNIMLGDGSAQEITSGSLTHLWLPNAQTWTNSPASATNQSGIRLVFP